MQIMPQPVVDWQIFACGGTCKLDTMGPKFGYHPNRGKMWLVVSTEQLQVAEMHSQGALRGMHSQGALRGMHSQGALRGMHSQGALRGMHSQGALRGMQLVIGLMS